MDHQHNIAQVNENEAFVFHMETAAGEYQTWVRLDRAWNDGALVLFRCFLLARLGIEIHAVEIDNQDPSTVSFRHNAPIDDIVVGEVRANVISYLNAAQNQG